MPVEAVVAFRTALEERTRERAPPTWATSAGNRDVGLVLAAEQLGGSARAKAAVQQIEVALAMMREGGNAQAAAYSGTPVLAALVAKPLRCEWPE